MNKVFVLPPAEDWIVDRFVREWREDNADISVDDPRDANVIWLFADWAWKNIDPNVYGFLAPAATRKRKVITTVHHIVPEKFTLRDVHEFKLRDQITTVYHVPNVHTEAFVKQYTDKPVRVIPYWANNKIWKITGSRFELRKKHGLPADAYLIGSFQRDTEGADLVSPKLEKGPDLLADYVELMKRDNDMWAPHCGYAALRYPHVVLAGWRRQYLISRLKAAGVSFSYFERPRQEVLNELYQTLDLYPVTARHEGGPQSLIECGLLGIHVVSRDVGMASQLLPASAINDDVSRATPAVPNVSHLTLPGGYEPFRKLTQEL